MYLYLKTKSEFKDVYVLCKKYSFKKSMDFYDSTNFFKKRFPIDKFFFSHCNIERLRKFFDTRFIEDKFFGVSIYKVFFQDFPKYNFTIMEYSEWRKFHPIVRNRDEFEKALESKVDLICRYEDTLPYIYLDIKYKCYVPINSKLQHDPPGQTPGI